MIVETLREVLKDGHEHTHTSSSRRPSGGERPVPRLPLPCDANPVQSRVGRLRLVAATRARIWAPYATSLYLLAACGGRLAENPASDAPGSAEGGARADDAWAGTSSEAGGGGGARGRVPTNEGGLDADGDANLEDAEASVLHFSKMNALDVPAIGLPQAIALGDVNGDGRTDVVVGNLEDPQNLPNVLVFYQASDGSMSRSPVKYSFDSSPLAIADVNGDGRNDVVTGTVGSIEVALQTGDGTLAAPVSYPLSDGTLPLGADAIVTGDFNADGKTDVIATSIESFGGAGSVSLFLQNASGALALPQKFTTLGGESARVADFNGDGLPDLITIASAGSATTIGVLPLASPGVFGEAFEANRRGASLGSISGAYFDVGDVTGDGVLDVVTTVPDNRPDAKVIVSPQLHGFLAAPVRYASADIPGPVCVVDVNMDGRSDVVVQHAGWFAVGVYLQRGDGTLAPEEILSSGYGQSNLAVGDVNGDGKPDIVTADQQKLLIFYNEY